VKEDVPDSSPADSEDKPRATRVAEGAWLGGVCTGLARHLGWPLMVVRIAFVALATFQFIGVIAYGALWLLLPPESTVKAPGLESASRAGLREVSKPKRRIDWGMLLALIALGVGLLWIMQNTGLGISSQLFWPVAFACAGAALVWRQADSEQQKRWRAERLERLTLLCRKSKLRRLAVTGCIGHAPFFPIGDLRQAFCGELIFGFSTVAINATGGLHQLLTSF